MAVDLEALSNDLDILTAFPLIEENIVATAKWFEGINPITGVSDGVKRWSTSGFVQRYDGATAAFVDLEWSKMVFGSSGMSIVDDAGVGLTISLDTSNQTILDADNAFGISVNNTEIIKAYSTGLAGVNTASPAYAWDVTGDINFTGTLYNNGSAVSLVTQTYVDAADTNLQSQITTLGTTDTSLQNQINTLGTTDTSLQTQITTLTSVIAQTSANFRGEWSSATTYQQYDQVLRNGIRYYSQVSSNLNNDPASSPTEWSLFVNVFSGNVGIGTISPLDLVHVSGGIRTSGAWSGQLSSSGVMDYTGNTTRLVSMGNATTRGQFQFYIQESDGGNQITPMLIYSTGAIAFGNGHTATELISVDGKIAFEDATYAKQGLIETVHTGSGSHDMIFSTRLGGTESEKFRIRSDGNVGIGTSSPNAPLHVDSSTGNLVAKFSSSDEDAYISFEDDGTTTPPLVGANDNDLVLWTNNQKRVTIDSSGKVGIGTSSPSAKLHIQSGQAYLNYGGSSFYSNTDDEFSKDYTQINHLQLNTAGFRNLCGITGVTGTAAATRSTTGFLLNSRYGASNFAASSMNINCNTGSGTIEFFTGTSSTAPTRRMIIDSSGNVGIGTSSPTAQLHIYKNHTSGTGEWLNIGFDDINPKKIEMGSASYNAYMSLYSASAVENVKLNSSGNSYFLGGNVGIGTSSPGAKLHVNGTTILGDDSWPTASIGKSGNRSGVIDSGEAIFLIHNANTSLSSGNAGELQVTARSSVASATHAGGKFRAGKENSTDGNEDGFIALDVTVDGLGYQESLRIDSSKNVGIGTSSPSEKLEVDGGIRPKSYTVATLPSATNKGTIIYVTDETGGEIPCFADGTNFRRMSDRAIVS